MNKILTAENGIKIQGYRNTALHGFFISLFFKGGSMYEREEDMGITHFLEHVLVRNVNKLYGMKLYEILDRYGLEFNASTYAEMVQFYLSGATQNFKHAADAAASLLSPIALNKSEIDAERRRIKAEIRENDDKNSMSSFAMGEVFSGTTLKNSITGTNRSVDKITAKRLEGYRKKEFTRDNLFFLVTGNFTDSDLEYLSDVAGKYNLCESDGEKKENIAPVPQSFGNRGANVTVKNGDYTLVRFNFDIDMTKVSSPAVDLIYDNLFAGYNAPFFIKMSEERGLFYDISGSTERYRNIGTLYFSFEVREKDIYDAVKCSVEILRGFKENLLSPENCMKAGYTDNAGLLLDDARELNFTFAYDTEIMGLDFADIGQRRLAYEKITPEDIRFGAREIFTPENLVLTVKGNKKKIDTDRLHAICLEL